MQIHTKSRMIEFKFEGSHRSIVTLVGITLLIMKCVIILDRSLHLPPSKCDNQPLLTPLSETKEQMCGQSTLSVKHTCITHMNDWSEKTLVIEPMCLLLHPSLKIPPCLIRTHPPHLKYVCHWLRPKVFKLGRIGCARLHTETHERDDESCFRGM